MEIDWDEVNKIIEERSSENSDIVKPNEMSSEDLRKISFLIKEVNRFPDNQKTVGESGALFMKHLCEKYSKLSPESIGRLVHTFCFMNR
ncbi:hypothetical protein P9E76_14175 [Schinkia azotoformans]|uniref:Uncharacterized protein n=1 Tax=Schinkia azotoformans LMG 9581 TaxID=1131731 RepID=K6DLJ4_SCHAZ|nr:hypothetical protein [Schinkia azotoformans]EKN69028.1 hypothetical protein BAZO_02152 [Schinkia azotoformans LMG 9581]MEC1638379.1 hypothetical protein [Schinkia azotoformans]MEC1946187.1 hypothetical protein [Schinkia azotoformans]